MPLDAIIIAESSVRSFSATNPVKLAIDGRTADIQTVSDLFSGKKRHPAVAPPPPAASWASAPKCNGIFLLDHLLKNRFQVELVNSYGEEKPRFARLLKRSPKAVVISTTFISDKEDLGNLVEDIRSQAPDIFIIVGGPFVFTSYMLLQKEKDKAYDTDSARQQFLFLGVENDPRADLFIVSQKGEKILVDVLNRLKNGLDPFAVANTARKNGQGYCFSHREDDLDQMDRSPLDWQSLPEHLFASGVIPIQASTGCAFNCAFCNFVKDRRLNHVRSLASLVADLRSVKARGARYVWFVDDNFRLGKHDLDQVCRRFIQEDLDLRWMTFIRADVLINADVDLLKRAGCIEVQLGIESADPQILKNMNKKANPRIYHQVLKKLRSAGINCSCYFIFGFPGETEESARRTRDFLKLHDRMDLAGNLAWSFFPFILSPLSPIYEPEARRAYALTGYMKNWAHRTMDSDRAILEIQRTFMAMENTGAIYRSDDQDLLFRLEPATRRAFFATRQRLTQAAWKGSLTRDRVLEAFGRVMAPLNPPGTGRQESAEPAICLSGG